MRSIKRMGPLKEAFADQVEIVEADLLDQESVQRAIQGSKYVVHTACPALIVHPKDEDELIKPAKGGTMAVMKAAH